jgi:hypothetical protein
MFCFPTNCENTGGVAITGSDASTHYFTVVNYNHNVTIINSNTNETKTTEKRQKRQKQEDRESFQSRLKSFWGKVGVYAQVKFADYWVNRNHHSFSKSFTLPAAKWAYLQQRECWEVYDGTASEGSTNGEVRISVLSQILEALILYADVDFQKAVFCDLGSGVRNVL